MRSRSRRYDGRSHCSTPSGCTLCGGIVIIVVARGGLALSADQARWGRSQGTGFRLEVSQFDMRNIMSSLV